MLAKFKIESVEVKETMHDLAYLGRVHLKMLIFITSENPEFILV